MLENAQRDNRFICHLSIWLVLAIMIVWNVINAAILYQTRQNVTLAKEKLDLVHISRARDLEDRRYSGESLAPSGEWSGQNVVQTDAFPGRYKRAARRMKRRKSRATKNEKKLLIHLAADCNSDSSPCGPFATNSENKGRTVIKLGDGSVNVSTPVYTIWAARNEETSIGHQPAYNQTDGRITVHKSGYYLLYAQITFRVDSQTKQFGVYLNEDDTVPIAECIAPFGHLIPRDELPGSLADQPDYASPEPLLLESRNFVQCHIDTVKYLKSGDQIYGKTMLTGSARSFIVSPTSYWTFLGLARL